MKLGFFVTNQYLPGEHMPQKIQDSAEQVRAARDAGFSLIATGQHYLAAPYQMSTLFPLLSRLAAEAGDMQVAATVILVPLHNPVELAESIATLDCITGGRFVFGVGLGYRDEEYTAFGVDRSERVERMNESLEVMKLLWSEEEVEFHGKYYHVPKVKPATRPVQKPHPPVLLGGSAKNVFKRVVAWGDGWLPIASDPEQIKAGRAALDELADAAGRDPKSIQITVFGVRADAETIQGFEAAGADRVIVRLPSTSDDSCLVELEQMATQALG